jgi:alpha-beta hydrolase superfamily lysophospholipase
LAVALALNRGRKRDVKSVLGHGDSRREAAASCGVAQASDTLISSIKESAGWGRGRRVADGGHSTGAVLALVDE